MFIGGTSELEVIMLLSSLPCHIVSVASEFSSPQNAPQNSCYVFQPECLAEHTKCLTLFYVKGPFLSFVES